MTATTATTGSHRVALFPYGGRRRRRQNDLDASTTCGADQIELVAVRQRMTRGVFYHATFEGSATVQTLLFGPTFCQTVAVPSDATRTDGKVSMTLAPQFGQQTPFVVKPGTALVPPCQLSVRLRMSSFGQGTTLVETVLREIS
ncbi:Hypothetical protein UVM_LOCUS198 [uncultured virus]|nr:Hypothetical protein UVM_LOCUS198 [uncultured virus]